MSWERKGHPTRGQKVSVDATGRKVNFDPPGTTAWLRVSLTAASAVDGRIFFSQQDFDDDDNYLQITPEIATRPGAIYDGPYENTCIWLKGVAGTADFALVHHRIRS